MHVLQLYDINLLLISNISKGYLPDILTD